MDARLWALGNAAAACLLLEGSCLNFPLKQHGATGQQPQSGGDPPRLLPSDSHGLNPQGCLRGTKELLHDAGSKHKQHSWHPVLLHGELELDPDRPLLTCGQGEGHPCPCLLV